MYRRLGGPHCIGGWVGPLYRRLGGPSLYRRLGGPPVRSGLLRKISHPLGFFFSFSEFRLLFSMCTVAILVSFFLFWLVPFVIIVQHTTQTFMPPAGFELAIPASEQPHTLSLDHSATRIGGIRSLDLSAPGVSLYRLSSRCVRCLQQYPHGRWWD